MKKKVSIIVPVYNVEKYLNRCISSLIVQSYSNIEILLINDGSKDKSLTICREYEKKDSRIRVFNKENEGLGLTRNYGINNAIGEYITFLDSDDYLTSDAIECMIEKADETDADVVVADMYYKNEVMKCTFEERLYTNDEIKILLTHMMGNYGTRQDAMSYTATGKLFKKKLFDLKNVQFPSERILIWEDLAFSMDFYPLCNKVYILKKPVYYYCFNEGSLTHSYKPNKAELVMNMYSYMKNKINKINLGNDALYRLDTNFIGHIRTCIKLEVYYSNKNGFKNAINNIRSICARKDVQILISNYPKSSFNKLQYIYNIFMNHQLIHMVYFLTWLQNQNKRIE